MRDFRVTVSTSELLAKLRENRDRHGKMYKEAVEGFLKEAKTKLESKLELVGRGVIRDISVSLHPPTDYTSQYETTIGMLEMHQEDTIELDYDEYRCFVEDEWDWLSGWLTSNSRWSNTAATYSSSKKMVI